ncbi:MAG: alpha-methylacyl-CoA racemase [Micromonosporaceae bacterium]|jgi:alpha-methylacyl-CoA racemase|nr:alpha-methylacyl-CoA racemase [Micromonosporaceae bacterium]
MTAPAGRPPDGGSGGPRDGVAGGPLRGLRVLELAGLGPGPFCAMLLADLGADVVRVDRPDRPDQPALPGLDPPRDLLNRGKRSIAVDLRGPTGAEVVRRLAARADVLIEGYRPGVAERLGVGPAECLARNPRLVYGRMTGWGQDGPLARTAGHDLTYLAVTGILHAIGPADGPPTVPLNLLADFAGGAMYLAVGVLAALREVDRSGRGQVVDAAMVDGVSHLATLVHGLAGAGLWQDRRGVNLLDGGAPFYGVYATADGQYMAVGPLEPRFFAEFVGLVRHTCGWTDDTAPPAQYDVERWPELREWIAAAFATRTRAEWTTVFAGTDACVSPVFSLAEAPHQPHLAARGTFATVDGVVQPAPAPRFSVTPPALGGPPATPGQHTAEILADWAVDLADLGAEDPGDAGAGVPRIPPR